MNEITTQLANESVKLSVVRNQQEKELKEKIAAHDEFVKSGIMRTL